MSKKGQTDGTHPDEADESLRRFFKNDKFAERSNIELLAVSPGQARFTATR